MDETTQGEAHGKTLPFRWDVTTAAGALALGALLYLVVIARAFKVSASGSARIGR